MKLVIGNKNYSSWSLRAWLMLSHFEIPFEEIRISLLADGYKAHIKKYSEAGRVPVLQDGNLVVWDSIAICEYLSDKYLNGRGWPVDVDARAEGRAAAAEMHSGFMTLRNLMPMNCRAAHRKVAIIPELDNDIARIQQLWSTLRGKYEARGPWLLGEFSIADCMYAPVAFRFSTYDVPLSPVAQSYEEQLIAHPKLQLWLQQSKAEQEVIEEDEAGL